MQTFSYPSRAKGKEEGDLSTLTFLSSTSKVVTVVACPRRDLLLVRFNPSRQLIARSLPHYYCLIHIETGIITLYLNNAQGYIVLFVFNKYMQS